MADLNKEWEQATLISSKEWDDAAPLTKGSDRSWTDVPGEAISNILPSTGRLIKGVVEPVLHPVKTLEGISRMARGGLGISSEEAPAWEATKQFFVNRYGSEDALKKTIATDPMGFAADISTILSGGGALAARTPGTIGKIGAAVRGIGETINPITAPIKAGVGVLNKVAEGNTASNLYQSALKPSTALSVEERLKRVKTGLDERIPVSEKGMAQLEEGIQGLNRDVSQIIATAANQNKTISKAKLTDELDKLQNFYIENYADPRPYVGAIDRVKNGMVLSKPNDIPIIQAQSVKQSIYKEIKDAYDAAKKAGPTPNLAGGVAARKNLARAIKQEIEGIVPEVKDLNARESAMIGLDSSIERAVSRISNWDVLGLAAPVVGAAAGVSPTSKIATTLAYRVIGSPYMKSRLAIALSKKRTAPESIGPASQALRATDLLAEQ
jgi:hypothetical protein